MGDYHGKIHNFILKPSTPPALIEVITKMFNGNAFNNTPVVTNQEFIGSFLDSMEYFFDGTSAYFSLFKVKRITHTDIGIHFEGYGSTKEVDIDLAVKFYESIRQFLVFREIPLLRTMFEQGGSETSLWFNGDIILINTAKYYTDEYDVNHPRTLCREYRDTIEDLTDSEIWEILGTIHNPYINGSATEPKTLAADQDYGYYMHQVT